MKVRIDGGQRGGKQPHRDRKYPLAKPVDQVRLQQAHQHSLEHAGSQRVRPDQPVNQRHVKSVQIAPMGGGLAGRRGRPPILAKGKPVPSQQAQRQVVIRKLVGGAGQLFDRISQVKRCSQAQQDCQRQDRSLESLWFFSFGGA